MMSIEIQKPSEPLVFRPAGSEDETALAGILNDAKDIKEEHGDNAWDGRTFSNEEVAGLIEQGGVYIGEANGMPIATVTLTEQDERIWGDKGLDGQALYVHKLARKSGYSGVGREAISFAETRARELGRQLLRLDNPAILNDYYEALGFQEVGSLDLGNYKPTLREKVLS